MDYCNHCGILLIPNPTQKECENCNPVDGVAALSRYSNQTQTELEKLSATKSGAIRKRDAIEWIEQLRTPNPTELKRSMLPKPTGFEGSSYETDISNIRFTGDARFIETIAGLLKPILDLENDETRLDINLQRTQERDTRQYTGNYALYLSVAERGGKK